MNLRRDLRYLYEWVPPRSRVLDLGCGDGALLATLTYEKDCVGYGAVSYTHLTLPTTR